MGQGTESKVSKGVRRVYRFCLTLGLACGAWIVLGVVAFFVLTWRPNVPAVPAISNPVIDLHLLLNPGQEGALFDTGHEIDSRPIYESKRIEGKDAQEIVEAMNRHLSNRWFINWCGHFPIYGIEVRDGEQLVMKTSVCFSCNSWTRSGTLKPILGVRDIENPLAQRLRQEIEIPENLNDLPWIQ